MLAASNIHYQIAERTRATAVGGIGAVHRMVCRLGLAEEIDRRLHLLKMHRPYHESDHVLNIAYNLLAGGKCLEHLELLRSDESYLDALGARRIPDPTTAGDFCRRFIPSDINTLMDVVNDTRVAVWMQQEDSFFEEAILDADGTMAEVAGECKRGMDINHKGQWGYHPLVVSLANTGEPLFLVNREVSRPSHELASEYLDRAIDVCRRGGFKRICLRGDTDFTQTEHLDRWTDAGVQFVFGCDATPKHYKRAENLEDDAWLRLQRKAMHARVTKPRRRPPKIKKRIVRERGYTNIELLCEDVAEFNYRPSKCQREYRVVVVWKSLRVVVGQQRLFDDAKAFFYITNDLVRSAEEIVARANHRCDQENLIQQLKSDVRAIQTPVDNLVSNWSYMVMASLAWSLKAWMALLLPTKGPHRERHTQEKRQLLRMDFSTFRNAIIRVPAQIVHAGRRVICRLLAWNRWQLVFFRFLDQLSLPLRR